MLKNRIKFAVLGQVQHVCFKENIAHQANDSIGRLVGFVEDVMPEPGQEDHQEIRGEAQGTESKIAQLIAYLSHGPTHKGADVRAMFIQKIPTKHGTDRETTFKCSHAQR